MSETSNLESSVAIPIPDAQVKKYETSSQTCVAPNFSLARKLGCLSLVFVFLTLPAVSYGYWCYVFYEIRKLGKTDDKGLEELRKNQRICLEACFPLILCLSGSVMTITTENVFWLVFVVAGLWFFLRYVDIVINADSHFELGGFYF
jgi:hypothetical protein